MQTIIAFKANGKITFVSNGNVGSDNYKIADTTCNIGVGKNKMVVVSDGSLLEVNITDDIALNLDKRCQKLTKDFVIDHIIPVIYDTLNTSGLIKHDNNGMLDITASFLVGYKDKLFYITNMFDVYEIEDFFVVGQYQKVLSYAINYIDDTCYVVDTKSLKISKERV